MKGEYIFIAVIILVSIHAFSVIIIDKEMERIVTEERNDADPESVFFPYYETYYEIRSQTPQDALMDAIEYYGLEYPYIVYAQAILETGNFQSSLCKESNNLFGLKRSGKYAKYNHWMDSVKDYMERVQNKYNDGDYYNFLDSIGYAEDSTYCYKLRKLAEEYEQYD